MNTCDRLLKLQILLNQLTIQIFASTEAIATIQGEVKLKIRSASSPLEQGERTVFQELLATRTRMDELLTRILAVD